MRPTLRRIIIAIATFVALNFACNALLKYGLHRFYGLDRHPHILLTGHSQLAQGSDKKGLEDSLGRNIAKFCLSVREWRSATCCCTMSSTRRPEIR